MLMQILQKLQIFQGIELTEAQILLGFSSMKQFPKAEMIYQKGDPSDDMLVLILGRLKVMGEDGRGVADIFPGASIGEMGVFTGQFRSATIIAVDKSTGLIFSKKNLQALMASKSHLKDLILKNMMELMSERLIEADRKVDEYMKQIQELGGKV